MAYTEQEIWELLSCIPDPEIPVITIADLGVLRSVTLREGQCIVSITPTYSGCPAMKMIEDDVIALLKEKGISDVKVNMVYDPAWTTDWLSEEAKEKLRAYGIAPPAKTSIDKGILMGLEPKQLKCPRCGSTHTEMISQFGSTACKALYRCLDCKEPFDYFKCI